MQIIHEMETNIAFATDSLDAAGKLNGLLTNEDLDFDDFSECVLTLRRRAWYSLNRISWMITECE